MKPAEGILFIACCVAHLYTWITASSWLIRLQNDAVSDTTKAEYSYIR